ncbi:MAG: restriction endonuclease subunit S [Verrucomicrobia bacterium]|nr:restriction endonuclease subunit S [Verrucomicrobiota bacterium]
MSYPAYPKHIATRWPDVGSVPSGWEARRLKFAVSLRNEKIEAEDSHLDYMGLEHIESWTGKRVEDESASSEGIATRFVEDDVLFGKLRPYLAKAYLADQEGMATTEALVLVSEPALLPSFLKHLLLSDKFINAVSGSTYGAKMPRANWEFIGGLPILLPPLAEQQQIAAFLDWKTGQIDALIARKQELLEKLKEKRITVITQAVTQGLNPAVPMRDSGIPWLGHVPQHWDVKRIKFIGRVGNGSTPSRENPLYWDGGDYPWLNSSVVNQEAVTTADQFVTTEALAECHLPIVQPPAVLIGITGEGKTRGMATTLLFEATINQHLAYLKPDPSEAVVGFVRRVFDMAYQYLRSESDGGGSTKGAITCEQIAEMSIPVPSIAEQETIAVYLATATQRVDRMQEKVESAITRLTEYRTALITAATTGKIDVRNVKVPAPAQP